MERYMDQLFAAAGALQVVCIRLKRGSTDSSDVITMSVHF